MAILQIQNINYEIAGWLHTNKWMRGLYWRYLEGIFIKINFYISLKILRKFLFDCYEIHRQVRNRTNLL